MQLGGRSQDGCGGGGRDKSRPYTYTYYSDTCIPNACLSPTVVSLFSAAFLPTFSPYSVSRTRMPESVYIPPDSETDQIQNVSLSARDTCSAPVIQRANCVVVHYGRIYINRWGKN